MSSRSVSITAIAVIVLLPLLSNLESNAEEWFAGQEVLVECPIWNWAPSPIAGVEYELCFDDIDHCAIAEIGDAVCIPSLGVHDVWVTAIDRRGVAPVHYDGDIVAIERAKTADFTGDGVVGIEDVGQFIQFYNEGYRAPGDFDEDGVIGIVDFAYFSRAYGKCIDASGSLYERC